MRDVLFVSDNVTPVEKNLMRVKKFYITYTSPKNTEFHEVKKPIS